MVTTEEKRGSALAPAADAATPRDAPGDTTDALDPAGRRPDAASCLRPDLGLDTPQTKPIVPAPDSIERWMLRSWASLAVASALTTSGLVLALAPLVRTQIENLWPWSYTRLSLLAALPLALAGLIVALTLRQRRLLGWRRQLDRSLEARAENFGRQTVAMTQEVQELESEIESRRQVERTLQAVAETLQQQLEEEKREAERQEQQLAAVQRTAEIQNARLREMNRMAHEFVSHVSHEFRTPLTVIREYATTMKEELIGDVTPEQYKYLDTIIGRVDDLIVMVNDVVDISSLEANILVAMRRTCSLDDVVAGPRDVLERKAAAAGVSLAVHLDPGLPTVYCDPDKAGRVLVNLGMNAIKFSEPGQVVEVWCRRGATAAEVVLGVSDHGPGIAAEHLERIFRCFEQLETSTRSSTKGFGLGLTIVRELVHLNFGRIEVQSAIGKGSHFAFTLPVAEPRTLLPLYVQRITATKRAARAVSLLSVCTESSSSASGLEEIEHYLVRHSRRTDLVIAAAPGHWLLVAPTDRAGTDRMLERLARGWSNVESDKHIDLPTLQWRIAGCFDIETRVDDLVRTFVDVSTTGPHAAGDAPAAAGP